MSDTAILDTQFETFSRRLFGEEVWSTRNAGMTVISLDGASPTMMPVNSAREITEMAVDLGAAHVSDEMVEALKNGHEGASDGTRLVHVDLLLKELYPFSTYFEGGDMPTEQELRLAGTLETWAMAHHRSFDRRMVPTGTSEDTHLRARRLVDSLPRRSDLGKVMHFPLGRIGLLNNEGVDSTYDANVHPRSTALYAALTTASLEDQVALSEELDQLIVDIHDHPELPVLGTSSTPDGNYQKHSFLVGAKSPLTSINYYGSGSIVLPMRLDSRSSVDLCAQAVHRDTGEVNVYAMSTMEPELYHSSVYFGFGGDQDTPLDQAVSKSDVPFISLSRLLDMDAQYIQKYHLLFRRMFPVFLGQVARYKELDIADKLVKSAEAESSRALERPLTKEAQITEVAAFARFIVR